MINFIADYHKLGIGFIFRECNDCGLLKIILIRTIQIKDRKDALVASTCVKAEIFKQEDVLMIELAILIDQLLDMDPDELNYSN
jgi:hypothetical protein